MADKCAKCKIDFNNRKDKIKCTDCGNSFHSGCCRVGSVERLRKFSTAHKASWRCDLCKSSADGSATNSQNSDNESVGESGQIAEMVKAMRNDINRKLDQQLERFESMESNYASLTQSFANLNTALEGFRSELTEHKEEVASLKKSNNELRQEVEELKGGLADLQQYTRRNNIEIRGIPVTENENVYEVLRSVAVALGLPYNRGDVSVAHRLKRYSAAPTPAIIVAFISRTMKAAWVDAARQRKLSTTDLQPSMKRAPIFINEHLSPQNRQLLGRARQLMKDGKLAYAWFKEGSVLVRATQDSRALKIKSLSDLEGF